jgi:hypothetical protein
MMIDPDLIAGRFKKGKPHGNGVATYTMGVYCDYNGEWAAGKFHGKGNDEVISPLSSFLSFYHLSFIFNAGLKEP